MEARKWSFFESNTRYNGWQASGLGNNPRTIESDQERRSSEVEAAIQYEIN